MGKKLSLLPELSIMNPLALEFMVEKHEGFYFLEINTRLQVEHPIVEEIIKIAMGKPLSKKQKELTINDHAIESHVYAEDPYT